MVAVVVLALVFYAVLPLWGAWRVRRGWDRFREAATAALHAREVDFSLLQSDSVLPGDPCRLTGTLEAFEGEDRLWVGNLLVSIAVSLRGTPVYFLDDQTAPFGPGVEPPRKAEASSLGALPEGTQFLVCGPLTRDDQGQVHFAATDDHRLLVLAFEGDPSSVLTRAVFSGRAPLDHWNSWTPLSLGVGFLGFFLLAWDGLRPEGDRSAGLWALALALLPATFFLPPGILLFYAFGRLWSRARDLRAQLALVRLRTEGDGEEALSIRSRARKDEVAAQASLGLGMVANVVLLAGLLRFWVS